MMRGCVGLISTGEFSKLRQIDINLWQQTVGNFPCSVFLTDMQALGRIFTLPEILKLTKFSQCRSQNQFLFPK